MYGAVMKKLKELLDFPKSELAIERGRSQANQDVFVLAMLGGITNGTFVEIGASDAKSISNTFLLESEFNWTGICFDISFQSWASFKLARRKANFVLGDATRIDFTKVFSAKNLPRRCEYLSLDIEPMQNTLKALHRLPLDEYRFKVITYETDFYDPATSRATAEQVRSQARRLLESKNYVRVASDVEIVKGAPFEDWWLDGEYFSQEHVMNAKFALGESPNYNQLLFTDT